MKRTVKVVLTRKADEIQEAMQKVARTALEAQSWANRGALADLRPVMRPAILPQTMPGVFHERFLVGRAFVGVGYFARLCFRIPRHDAGVLVTEWVRSTWSCPTRCCDT
jgi:hypothetical protein